MFSILISILILSFGGKIIHSSLNKIITGISLANEIKEINKEMADWDRTVAVVTKIEVFCEYDFPGMEVDTSHIKNEDDKKKHIEKFTEQTHMAKSNRALYGNINISYKYSSGDKLWESRTIGLLPETEDVSAYNKFKEGTRIKIFVNPKDRSESYIRKTSKKEIEAHLNRSVINSLPVLICGAFAILLAIINMFSDLIAF